MTQKSPAQLRADASLAPFVKDIAPMFTGQAITYVDAGAYDGSVYKSFAGSGVRIHNGHLVEASPVNMEKLRKNVAGDHRVVLHEVALGDHEGHVQMELRRTMSRVVDTALPDRDVAQVRLTTLDALIEAQELTHIHLLKIDVEGSELALLRGARKLLAANAVDIIYIEAGMSGDSPQQVHHRDIENALEEHGYRLMGVYEQTKEWIEDLPTLRRANLGFISTRFAQSHPFRLSRELLDARTEVEELSAQRALLTEQLATALGKADDYRLRAKRSADALAQAKTAHAGAVSSTTAGAAALAAAHAERDAYVAWGAQTDLRLRRVLASRWWRLTRIPRAVVRRTRARLGRAVAAPIAPLPRPRLLAGVTIPTTDGAATLSRLIKGRRFPELHREIRRLELLSADNSSWLLLQSARIGFDFEATAYENVARTAEGVVGRRGSLDASLAEVLGDALYRTTMTQVAKAYGRLGRADEAIAHLTGAIDAGHRELRLVRAEVAYPTDPAAAVGDLTMFLGHASATHPQRARAEFLLAHLELSGPAATTSIPLNDEAQPELRVAHAIAAHAAGDAGSYATNLNAFFSAHGLVPVLAEPAADLAGNAWVSPTPAPSPHAALVTVIVTAYNAESTLASSVASLLGQSHGHLEIIVVDDVSTDGTLEIAKGLAQTDGRISVLEAPRNGGTYAAKNLALGVATGDYVTFHDSDDWAHPQRIERHLDVMEADPAVLATRSDWLRITAGGAIEVRRWGMTAPHPNPASAFFTRAAIEQLGVFDPVAFGADSEYWFRAQRILPPRSTRTMRVPLGIGLHHEFSLTRAGAGAWSVDHYSAVRSAYQLSWTEFHATVPPKGLAYRAGEHRLFWAPPAMLREPDPSTLPATRANAYPLDRAVPQFVFAISMISMAAARDWERAQELLDRTLHSIVGQSDPRWTAVVSGHERPDLTILDDPRIVFISAPTPAPTKTAAFRADKNVKRRINASYARALGGGYFFPLDADDLVHRDVVAHVLADHNERGYVATSGYAEDFLGGRLAPVPGAWTLAFDRVCGSAIVLYFEREDLPAVPEQKDQTYFDLFSHHAYWAGTAEEYRGPLDPIPFPAGVYALNTGQNISFQLQRANRRGNHIIESIEAHAIDDRFRILRDEFGQR